MEMGEDDSCQILMIHPCVYEADAGVVDVPVCLSGTVKCFGGVGIDEQVRSKMSAVYHLLILRQTYVSV